MKREYKIFAVNPGSTSTKIAMFKGDRCIFSKNVGHDSDQLKAYGSINDQLPYRKKTILTELEKESISLKGVDAFVGRGGGSFSVAGGTYEISGLLLEHTKNSVVGVEHPAKLGIQLADEFVHEFGGRGFIVNPPNVDEYQDIARVTGIDGVYRSSNLHALNQKEMAIRHADSMGRKYEDCNFIGCHIGGGISVVAHRRGRMIDGNDIVGGEGPMAPTRCGSLPVIEVMKLCFSESYTVKELKDKMMKSGGFADILGTSDAREVIRRASEGDRKAKLYWEAMIYQIIKMVGAMAAVLKGEVDGILLGGGMVHDRSLVDSITEACDFIARVTPYPGEFEMEAMAAGAIRILSGKEQLKTYQGKPVWSGFDFRS